MGKEMAATATGVEILWVQAQKIGVLQREEYPDDKVRGAVDAFLWADIQSGHAQYCEPIIDPNVALKQGPAVGKPRPPSCH